MEGLGRSPRSRLRTIAPEPGLAPLMCHCENADLSLLDLVNDAVGKAPQRQAPGRAAPSRAKFGMLAQQFDRTFKLGDERAAELSIRFTCVEQGAFNEILLRLGCDRDLHPSACRAR